jgi:hypothetical protein
VTNGILLGRSLLLPVGTVNCAQTLKVLTAAGFDWREPGCSMCLAMNDDKLEPGERCASTHNAFCHHIDHAFGRPGERCAPPLTMNSVASSNHAFFNAMLQVRVHFQPKLRRAARYWRSNPSDESLHGSSCCADRSANGCAHILAAWQRTRCTRDAHLDPPSNGCVCPNNGCVRCSFFVRILHTRMPLDPTHVRLKLIHACDQWHSSRESTASYRYYHKLCRNTEGLHRSGS